MGCNRTPTEKEARAIREAASRVVAEVGGASTARAEQLVAIYGEARAKAILREEQQAQQQAWSSSWGSSSSTSSSYSFEQPVWTSSSNWQQEAERYSTDQRAADQRAADQRAADQRAADQRAADQRAADQRAADQRAADQRAADQRAADQRAADQRAADQRAADQRAADQRAADQRSADQRAADQRAADQRAADQNRKDEQARQSVNQSHFHHAPAGSYQHQMDAQGRVVSNEGWLTLAKGKSPNTDGVKGKDRGHLIGKQFGGLGDQSNIVNMDPRINRSFINAFEGCIADHVRNGMELYLRVRVEYGASGHACALHYDIYQRDQGWHSTMTIDPNTERTYTLAKAAKKGGWTVCDFVDPFRKPDGDRFDA